MVVWLPLGAQLNASKQSGMPTYLYETAWNWGWVGREKAMRRNRREKKPLCKGLATQQVVTWRAELR